MNNDLWSAIYCLYLLLERGETSERVYQTYFENNPIVFHVLGFPRFASYEKSSGNKLPYDAEFQTQREPDFICARPITQEVTVFEIKTPVDERAIIARKDGQRAKLSAILESYLSQTTEYINFIAGNAAARDEVRQTLDIRGVAVVDGVLVYGLADMEEAPIITRLAAGRQPRISIVTYDQILQQLVEAYSRGRPDVFHLGASDPIEGLKGMTLVLHVVLSRVQEYERGYILDIGELEENRISIYLQNGLGRVEVVDGQGRGFHSEWQPYFETPTYLRIEICTEQDRGFISVFSNNAEVDLRMSSAGVNVSPNLNKLYLGSDISECSFGRFLLLEHYLVGRTMTLKERIGSHQYFCRKVQNQKHSLEFSGEKFMRRAPDGSMRQEDVDRRPVFRERIHFDE